MKLAWSDDFNGKEVDESKWNVLNSTPGAVKIVDGILRLECLPGKGPGFWQGSGVNTHMKFSQAYGYFEASMKMLQTTGRTGRFEVRHTPKEEPPTARLIYNSTGNDNILLSAQVADNSGVRNFNATKPTFNLEGGASYKKFHTYGFYWTPKYFEWYVDGKKAYRVDRPETPSKPMYLEFVHYPPEGGEIPQFTQANNGPEPLMIDWVKVWK
jgi:beta-glucanase (GH16 family)